MYLILMLSLLFVSFAQMQVTRSFNKFSVVQNKNMYKGVDVAYGILRNNDIYNVQVKRVNGHLTDHYNPTTKTIYLSQSVYDSYSLSAIAVAAHEVGHAIQDAEGYYFLRFRSRLVPFVNIASRFTWVLIFTGMFINAVELVNLGIIFFSLTVLFQVVTLPVEFDASKKAMYNLEDSLYIRADEVKGTKKVLRAAALTYVASTIYSIVNLIRLIDNKNKRN